MYNSDNSLTIYELHYYTDEVQSLGLWNDKGRVKFSGVTLFQRSSSATPQQIRLVRPGQSLSCFLVCICL